jgi:putative FmdB family regulatory protein
MPTYDYKCENCGDTQELILTIARMNEPVDTPCPKCDEVAVKRHITGASRIVSGTGSGLNFSSGWNDILKGVQSGHPRSNLNTK